MVKKFSVALLAIVLLAVLILLFSSVRFIKEGTVGVVSKMGAVQEEVLYPGANFVTPFITSVSKMDIQEQIVEVETTAASKDLQTINIALVVNYHLDEASASSIFKNVGLSYETKIIAPSIQESVKQVVAQYSTEQLITNRREVGAAIKDELTGKTVDYGILLDSINITNFDYSDQFRSAIEAKQTAEQEALRAEQELARVTIEAQQQVEQAKAEADAIMARADAEAYAIRIIQEQLAKNPAYIQYFAIERWNGIMPYVNGGSGTIINFSDLFGGTGEVENAG